VKLILTFLLLSFSLALSTQEATAQSKIILKNNHKRTVLKPNDRLKVYANTLLSDSNTYFKIKSFTKDSITLIGKTKVYAYDTLDDQSLNLRRLAKNNWYYHGPVIDSITSIKKSIVKKAMIQDTVIVDFNQIASVTFHKRANHGADGFSMLVGFPLMVLSPLAGLSKTSDNKYNFGAVGIMFGVGAYLFFSEYIIARRSRFKDYDFDTWKLKIVNADNS